MVVRFHSDLLPKRGWVTTPVVNPQRRREISEILSYTVSVTTSEYQFEVCRASVLQDEIQIGLPSVKSDSVIG